MSAALASMVALRYADRDPHFCAAWIESADRVCGKPGESWMCPRHEKVARARLLKAIEKDRADRVKAEAERERMRPKWEADLERVEARLGQLDPPMRPFDHGEQNMPLRKRIPSDARIHEMAGLHKQRDYLRMRLGL